MKTSVVATLATFAVALSCSASIVAFRDHDFAHYDVAPAFSGSLSLLANPAFPTATLSHALGFDPTQYDIVSSTARFGLQSGFAQAWFKFDLAPSFWTSSPADPLAIPFAGNGPFQGLFLFSPQAQGVLSYTVSLSPGTSSLVTLFSEQLDATATEKLAVPSITSFFAENQTSRVPDAAPTLALLALASGGLLFLRSKLLHKA